MSREHSKQGNHSHHSHHSKRSEQGNHSERAQARTRQDARAQASQTSQTYQTYQTYQQRRDANPLSEEEKRRLEANAAYMVARLTGIPMRPPDHWPPEQVAAFAAVLADPQARAAALAWVMEGVRAVERRSAHLDP